MKAYRWLIIPGLLLFACNPQGSPLPEEPELRLNEFMARNDSTVVDERGEADDWIELYNRVEMVDDKGKVEKYYLTDDPEEIDKWRIPDTVITSHGFLFIWADNDTDQGQMHANFRLAGDGEFLGLYRDTDSGLVVVDSLTYPAQFPDTSYGRVEDGYGDWEFMSDPSPGLGNL